MRAALALARRGLGNTWPNPAVGCVIVREGRVVGRGWTAPGGRPHAEARGPRRWPGEAARGGTAYVTLEPCSHHGRTPPCADALVAAGIARVRRRLGDPDPRVNGRGIARLRAAGVRSSWACSPREAAEAAGRLPHPRPRGAGRWSRSSSPPRSTAASPPPRGESQWITGPEARRAAPMPCAAATTRRRRHRHRPRRRPGAHLPPSRLQATCPTVRVVADTHLRIRPPPDAAPTAREAPTWVLHARGRRRRATRDPDGAGRPADRGRQRGRAGSTSPPPCAHSATPG